MQSRLAIILMSVAGTAALFGIGFLLGLGVMSTSKPEHHKEIALTTQPTKVARAETTASGQADEPSKKADDSSKSDDRALTPLTPVAPGGAAAQAAAPAPVQSQQASAKPVEQPAAPHTPAPPQQAAAVAPPPPAPKDEPKAKEAKAAAKPADDETAKSKPAPNATPVSFEGRKACDVDACASAYKSFRESDCSYQPYSGPRQMCVNPPSAKEASRGHEITRDAVLREDEPRADVRVHRPGRDVELDNVAHEVERITTDGRRPMDDEGPIVRRYHRDFTADGEDDRIVPADVDRGGFDDEYDDQ